jgi:hypothetical protein
MSALPAPESIAAHDALIQAYVAWRGEEASYDDAPTPLAAALADLSWLRVVAHAQNCGCRMSAPDVLGWVRKRIVAYAQMLGHAGMVDTMANEPAHVGRAA